MPPHTNTPSNSPIAILEDAYTDRKLLEHILAKHDYATESFSSGKDLLNAIQKGKRYTLLLLDWEMPGINGFDVLQWTRENLHAPPPVIFITNRILESDVVNGLSAGANDYIVKPVKPRELIARIQVQLRLSTGMA